MCTTFLVGYKKSRNPDSWQLNLSENISRMGQA
jgi:hypothetical protein